MNHSALLLLLALAACSKKKDEQAPVAPPTPGATSATTGASSEPKPADAAAEIAPVEEAIDAELVLPHELALAEGKVLPAPKFVKATADDVKAHAAALQSTFEDEVKGGCKELSRFNASHVPATYVICELPARAAVGSKILARANVTRMISVEGTTVNVEDLSSRGEPGPEHGDPTAFELWNTPRGYYLDLDGSGTPTYFLRRRRKALPDAPANEPGRLECRAKVWNPETGAVSLATEVPHFPTRGRDVDGDGKPEYPDAIVHFALSGYSLATAPTLEGCDLPTDGGLAVDVVGITSKGEFRSFYEHRLTAARARATKIRALQAKDKLRKKGDLLLTNHCAIDAAQAAAEVFTYARLTGVDATTAIAEADAVMEGYSLILGECRGAIQAAGADATKNRWVDLRSALFAWTSAAIPAPAAPSAAPSASASQ